MVGNYLLCERFLVFFEIFSKTIPLHYIILSVDATSSFTHILVELALECIRENVWSQKYLNLYSNSRFTHKKSGL